MNNLSSTDPALTRPRRADRPAWAGPRRRYPCGCLLLLAGCMITGIILISILMPSRTNILVLGLDSREPGSNLGRSDTMILATVLPREPYVGMLSIPRDLWVTIPGIGENRINTAHYFAEADHPGSGPAAAVETVVLNFGVDVDYYVRMRFDGFQGVVDTLDGVDVELPRPMSGYNAGTHHLNGEAALALVRDRAGSDDFFRMERGQIFLKALMKRLLTPSIWPRLPKTLSLLSEMVDTNIPPWLWVRFGLTILRVGPNRIDTRSITREMVDPFTTSGGAQVLAPDWAMINPVLLEMFGQ